MNLDQFNELCRREHEQDDGMVVHLHLKGESYAELLREILAAPGQLQVSDVPEGPVGFRLDTMVNPATGTPVLISRTPPFAPDTAEVRRWVSVPAVRPDVPQPP